MDQTNLQQTQSIAEASKGSDNEPDAGCCSLYGAVKLKETGVDRALTAPKRYDSDDGLGTTAGTLFDKATLKRVETEENANNGDEPNEDEMTDGTLFDKAILKKVETVKNVHDRDEPNEDETTDGTLFDKAILKKVETVKNVHDDDKPNEDVASKPFEGIRLKKTGVNTSAKTTKEACKSFEKQPSSDTNNFDEVKLKRSASVSCSYQKSTEPAFDVDSLLKHTGKVDRAKSHLDEPRPNDPTQWLSSVLAKANIEDKEDQNKFVAEADKLYKRIQDAGGLPVQRRLSISDNDLVSALTKAAGNDPTVTEICIDGDIRIQHVRPEILTGFAEGVRTNLHLCQLVIRNCGLGNDFLSALADSVRTNFMLETVDLSNNAFTNDSLVDFCLSMADNESLRTVILTDQQSPIFTLREDLAVEALRLNRTLQDYQVEFQTAECRDAVKEVMQRNQEAPGQIQDYGQKLLDYLENEATNAEKRLAEQKEEVRQSEVQESDMPFLYELSELAHQYKLPYETATEISAASSSQTVEPVKVKISLAQITANLLTADGAFLTDAFISEYLHKDESEGSLTFDFNNQMKVFKRFSITDPARAVIVKKFVDRLVDHPDAKNITHITMVNSLIGNDWVRHLSERCLEDSSLLPSLHFLNLETNFIDGPGVTAIAKCIANPDTWKYLQAVKLDNQKRLISSDAEDELARSLCVNRSVIKLSLRVRNLFERRKINNYITRNVDFLRQARHWHAIKTGTLKERARNKVEQLFDLVAQNSEEITAVSLIADQVFLTLHPSEVLKAAKSFANNTHVKKVKMSGLRLDSCFAIELAKSIAENRTMEQLDLETNMIDSEGAMALVSCLSTNRSITELQLRHQSKSVASSDEEKIAELLVDNTVIVKLGLDLRSTIARHSLDRKLRQNQEIRRQKAPKRAPSGTRNRVQQLFDSVAANSDPTMTEISVIADPVFLSMNPVEILKTAQCFANNEHVKKIKMSGLRLDDHWAITFAKSLETNKSIETINLESNSIGSLGMLAIVSSLSQNNTITDLLLRHQTKQMVSSDEEKVPVLIAENPKIVKLSIDLRSVGAKSSVDKKLRQNLELRRKSRKL